MAQWYSTVSDEAIRTNAPGFESRENQLQFDAQVVSIIFFSNSCYMVLGPYLLCSFRQPGQSRRKRHFGASNLSVSGK